MSDEVEAEKNKMKRFSIILCSVLLVTRSMAQPNVNTQPGIQVNSIKFSPNGKLLASGLTKIKGREYVGREVRLWDVATGKLLRVIEGKTNHDVAVVFSPDGETVASLGIALKQNRMIGSQVSLWKTATGEALPGLEIPAGETVLSLSFSPDGKVLAGGSIAEKDGKPQSQVKLWDAQNGKLNRSFGGLQGCPCGVSFSPDGKSLAASGWRMKGAKVLGSEVKIWDLATDKIRQTITLQNVVVQLATFSPDGKTLATKGSKVEENNGVGHSNISLWDVESGKLKHALTRHAPTGEEKRDNIESIAFSSDSKMLMSGGIAFDEAAGDKIWMWDVQSGRLLRTLKPDKEFGNTEELTFAADLSADGKMVAIGTEGQSLRIISAQDGSLIRSFNLRQP